MARPKSPDGKSTLLAFKISASQQAAYDAARGALPMADWARSVLDAASGGTPVTVPRIDWTPTGNPAVESRAGTRRPRKPAVPQAAFSDPPVNPLPAPRCNHPGIRVTGGWCVPCQRAVQPGGG